MNHSLPSAYDEALARLHRTGPEFDGFLANHGPMTVEVLARRSAADRLVPWTDAYLRRLDEPPRPTARLDEADWRAALGDVRRSADWSVFFTDRLREAPWTDVLVRWWPRLLPGIAGGATHGVIRTGHAVQALRAASTPERTAELAHALAYWAARWRATPLLRPVGTAGAPALVRDVPRVPVQQGGLGVRLDQITEASGWHEHGARLRSPALEAVPGALDALVDAVVLAYPLLAHGSPTILVHAATAPTAVRRVLPSLPVALWRPSHDHAWSAAAAVLAAYRPAVEAPAGAAREERADDVWERAVTHGGEHVVKFADAALETHGRTGSATALAAVVRAIELDA